MKYPVLLVAVALLISFVVSESLRGDATFSYSSQDYVSEGVREGRSAAAPAAVQPEVQHINYRPYSQVPANIKQLLQFQQAREPITHIAAQPPPQLAKAPSPDYRGQYNPQVQHAAQPQAQQRPQYQPQPQQNYQQQQSPQQIQSAYNPQQQIHGNQQQAPGNIFRPEQRRLY